jgi:hypothetical protein
MTNTKGVYDISNSKILTITADDIILPTDISGENVYRVDGSVLTRTPEGLQWIEIFSKQSDYIVQKGCFIGIDPDTTYDNISGPSLGLIGYVKNYDLTTNTMFNYNLSNETFHNLETANISAGVYILNYSYMLKVKENQTDVSARILIGTSNVSNDINSGNIYIENEPYTNLTNIDNEYYRNIKTTHVVTNNLQINTIYINYNCTANFNIDFASLSFRATRIG